MEPLTLTKEMKIQIADLIADGLDPEADKQTIANTLGVEVGALKEAVIKERHDRLLKKAEQTSESLLDIDLSDKDVEHKYGKARIDLMKLKLKEAEFIRSTLGKDEGYSSRSEITGKNGEEIRIKEIIFSAPVMPNTIKDIKNS